MTLAVCTTSHSPLMALNPPSADIVDEVEAAFAAARTFIDDFDPELVVIFGPDHYNGLLYDLMPPFCVGYAATGVGDYGTDSGALDVDVESAGLIAEAVLAADVDTAVSYRLRVDHGFMQPLELLLGDVRQRPVVPIFVNCVAQPLAPMRRVRRLGEAVGKALLTVDRRVLVVGSGGLSHDPPVPALASAEGDALRRLLGELEMTSVQRAVRESRVLSAAQAFTAGESGMSDLNPVWDGEFLDLLQRGDLDDVAAWSNQAVADVAGGSAHEVRTWVAAYSALAATGQYEMTSRYYRPIREWIAGFSITTAVTANSHGGISR